MVGLLRIGGKMKNKIMIGLMVLLMACGVYGATRIETTDIVFSNATVKITGTNQATDALGYGGNGLQIDGISSVDKDILFLDDGVKKFSWEMYRGESGKFFYLYNFETLKEILSISRSGRVGINKMNNLLNYHTLGPWADQSSDLEINSELTVYSKNNELVYRLTVDGVGNPNTYKIETAPVDSGPYTLIASTQPMVTTNYYIGNGIYLYWTQTTGHTIGQVYKFLGIPQLPRATFGICPPLIDEVMLSTNLMTRPAVTSWIDRTYEANSSEYGLYRPFRLGTNSALYIGMMIPNNAFYVDLATSGVGVACVREYWDGSNWKAVPNVVDGTLNYTKSGTIAFDNDLMSDWAKTNLIVDTYTNQYYWYRMYSTNPVTTEPWVQSFTRHGGSRFNVYESPFDSEPKMQVDASGNTWVGGLPLTPAIVQTFYYKFLAQSLTQTVASAASVITPFVTEISDVYNVYTNAIWYPNSTSLVRMNWSIRTSAALQAGRGWYTVLFENGVAIRDIGVTVSGDNADVPISNGTYIFKPSSATNYYQIGVRRFSGNDVTLAGGNTNWWFGEKIQ